MTVEFDQGKYWVKRHEDLKGDPRSVGTLAASREANEQGERELQRLAAFLAGKLAADGARTVLDLGCGYGRVAGSFIESGFKYTGIDISPVAIATAEAAHPQGQFIVGNLSDMSGDEQFDVVLILYVLVHFVDDRLWRDFLDSAIRRLKPGGRLVIADIFPEARTTAGAHVVSRPLSEYLDVFGEAGLVVDPASRAEARKTGINASNHFHFAIAP